MEDELQEHLIVDLIKDCGATKGVEKFWDITMISDVEICKHFLQFLIDMLSRDYLMNDDDVMNINEELVSTIFSSDITFDHELPDHDCKQIIGDFLDEAYDFDLCKPVVEKYQTLLTTFIKCNKIPSNDEIIGQCYLFLSYLLDPLTRFYTKSTIDPLNDNDSPSFTDCTNYVSHALKSVIDLIPGGASFTEDGIDITLEFLHMVEKSPDMFINKMGLLSKYAYLLHIDNNFLLFQVIRSLKKLVTVPAVRDAMIKFFFSSFYEIQEVRIKIRDMLFQIATQKGLTSICCEIFQLFITITELDKRKKLFTKDERLEIYKSAINSGYGDTIRSLMRMMIYNEGSLFPPLIETFNAMQVTGICVLTVIQRCNSFECLKIENIVGIILKHIPYSKTSIRACQVFKHFLEHGSVSQPDKNKILLKIHENLIRCDQVNDEIAYETFVSFVLNVPRESFFTALKRTPSMKNGLIGSLLRAFKKFSFPKTLQAICKLLKVIKGFDAKLLKDRMKPILKELYEEFIEIDAMEIAELPCSKDFDNSLVKMQLFFQTELYTFTDYFEYDAVFIINRKHLIDKESRYFLLFARWQVTVLKSSFAFLLNRLQNNEIAIFPCTLEKLMEYVGELRETLMNMKMEVKNNFDAMLLLTSIFEIHHAFTSLPMMFEKTGRVLHIKQPKMEIAQFKKLINVMNANIYSTEDKIGECSNIYMKYNDSNFSVKFLESFTEFMKSYTYLPNYLQIFKILHHYTHYDFHGKFQTILKFIQMKPEFLPIIGLAIMNFALTEGHQTSYKVFVAYINKFLDEEDKIDQKVLIVKFVLKNLQLFFKQLKPAENRMKILRLVATFMPRFTEKDAREIEELIGNATSKLTLLKQEEIEAMEKFIGKLQ